MLLRAPGVAPEEEIDELQFRLSLLEREGLIRSSDFPDVDVFNAGLFHDGEYRTLSMHVSVRSRRITSSPELFRDKSLFATATVAGGWEAR